MMGDRSETLMDQPYIDTCSKEILMLSNGSDGGIKQIQYLKFCHYKQSIHQIINSLYFSTKGCKNHHQLTIST